ncbi:MAG: 4Fe-4S dicluster domain-containing protein [Sandaracinaceae bacterium]|nr:4Fe-4S dicluster domain-containing protein [Sandaracinaceae bacterium]
MPQRDEEMRSAGGNRKVKLPVVWPSLERKRLQSEQVKQQGHGRDEAKDEHVRSFEERGESLRGDEKEEATHPGIGRRAFLELASVLSAFGAGGCLRRPAEAIMPHAQAPEYALPGIALHFATVLPHNGEAVGVIVEQHEGRPTKIEGNPDHPASNPNRLGRTGGTGIAEQAAILCLYDQDRSNQPIRRSGEGRVQATWADFEAMAREHFEKLKADGGSRILVLHEPVTSPTFVRLKRLFLKRFPRAEFFSFASVSDASVRSGLQAALGRRVRPVVDYSAARILSLDCDFLQTEPGNVRASRLFAQARRLMSPASSMNRLYVVESTLSLTGANADHRLRLASSRVFDYALALTHALAQRGLSDLATLVKAPPKLDVPREWIEKVADDLIEHRGRAVVVAGSRQPPALHALVAAINQLLAGSFVQYVEVPDPDEKDPLEGLARVIERSAGATLVILGGNPVYGAPSDLPIAEAISRAELSIHLSLHDDETSRLCTWHLPMAHPLESWGDHQSIDGTIAIQQPLIAPLCNGRSDIEILALLAGEAVWSGYHNVRRTFAELTGGLGGFESAWRRALHRGVVDGAAAPVVSGLVNFEKVKELINRAVGESKAREGWEVVFAPCPKVFDGRYLNNPWLLELPDPITKVSWDNAAMISPRSAEELGVRNGRMIQIEKGGRAIEVPVVVVPGHADRSITLTLGWGRSEAGRFAKGYGFNVAPLRTREDFSFGSGFEVKAKGRFHLVITQEHHSMDQDPHIPGVGRIDLPPRPLAIVGTLEEYAEKPDFPQWLEPTPDTPPLWPEVDYKKPLEPAHGGLSWSLLPVKRPAPKDPPHRHAWGMAVDLTTCIGCSACVVACTAENNVATVGKDQVARGREMHWLRIDRYFVGEDESNPPVAFLPVACQHCEEAPCENVCPVNATEHSPEGLNEMAYNRCIGTRYCMNNCPYKVRRFNYLAYQAHPTEFQRMQFNPNVSVRMRGVMEKCTYCIQRIQAAKIAARNANRRLMDGDVVPACAQACPTQAIVFGDLNDPNSLVSQLSRLDRHYKLLAQVGTQPRTTYLARIRNPNPNFSNSSDSEAS